MLEQLRSAVPGAVWPAIPGAGGAAFLAVQFQLERSQWLDKSTLWSLQRKQLRALLDHAAASSPFHASRLASAMQRLPPDFSPAQFSALPILLREDVQAHAEEIACENVPREHGKVQVGSTSGSTGKMVRYLSTDLAGFYWQAMNVRDHLWHGRDFGLKLATIRAGGGVERMKNWFGEVGETTLQTGTCVLIPTGTPIPQMADIVQSEDPAYLTGYVNNVVAILRHIDAKAGRLPSLRQVRSFGETVTQAARDYVRQRWGVPLIDLYSAREVGYIALQCPDAGGYHVQAEGTYVEILREDGTPCGPGEIGRVVVTPLHNFAFPLIRYNIEDLAEVGPACSCGRGLPVLRRILGRSRNLVKFRDGRTQWPDLGVDKFLSIAPIRQFQFVQHSYDDLEIRLAVERPLTEDEQASFGRHILERFKHPFHIRWIFLDEIPYAASGKFEDFIRTFDD